MSEGDLPDLVLVENEHKVNAVPIVEVTPANNHQLIDKYKKMYVAEKSVALVDELQSLPKMPLRRKSSSEYYW